MATLSSSSSAFIPTQRHHTSQSATLLFTKPSNFSLLPFPPVSRCRHLRRRRSTPSSSPLVVCAASLKEKIDGLNKTWSNITSLNHWVVREYGRLVNSVNVLEPQFQKLSDEQLSAKTLEFRRRLREGESISHIQAEAFSVVREAAKRKLGMRHFDVQIIGGAVLHDGAIAEMKTGEGKTLVSTLAAYLNALTGEGVHVVTVNDYLAQRDAEWMGRVHRFLGLSVGLIQAACGLNIKLPMEKIEDIDARDVYNESAVVEYAEDIYKFYKEAEANHLCRRHLQVLLKWKN